MKIKVKLTIWVGLLFTMILALAAISTIFIKRLKNDTSNILKSNNSSVEYGRQMLEALELMKTDSVKGYQLFQQNIENQKSNISEPGERDLSAEIETLFLEKKLQDNTIKNDINKLMQINMSAIQRKSEHAEKTADNATTVIVLTGTLCFIVAFILLFNLPGNIADPIKELTNSIQQIANHNYAQRIHFEKNNEFGVLANSFNIMAEKLEEYSNTSISKLLVEKKRIETLIDKMQDPVLGLDEDFKILFINEKAILISGLERTQVIGKNVKDIAMHNDLVRLLVKDIFVQQANETKSEPIKIFADGKESYFEKETISIEITVTGEKKQNQAGHVIVLKNITPFKELDLAKTNFIANVSHELKTPIASIKLGTELLIGEPDQTHSAQLLVKGIEEDADRLLKITSELLNMTQAESGNIQIKKENVQLDEILTNAINAVKTTANQKQIHIENNVQNEIVLFADNDKTTWVITNLLSNAIRYSPENTTINISSFPSHNKTRIEIADQGFGIDDIYKDRIFERYFKIPGLFNGGTGLGLSICKEFMEGQEGSIGVYKNKTGIGSIFYIEI